MNDIKRFYQVLFNVDECTCFGQNVYDTHASRVSNYIEELDKYPFFSINPLKPGANSRKDSNVTCFRNFLLEFDSISLVDQLNIIAEIPISTVVFSGSKSYHAIISLEEPCKNREEYDTLMQRILEKVPEADPTARNPSRFSRAPGALRDNVVEQHLEFVDIRISREVLEKWLGPSVPKPKTELPTSYSRIGITSPFTKYFLAFGAENGTWNRNLFIAVADMTRAGYAKEHIMEQVRSINGYLDASDKRTIASAVRTAKKET